MKRLLAYLFIVLGLGFTFSVKANAINPLLALEGLNLGVNILKSGVDKIKDATNKRKKNSYQVKTDYVCFKSFNEKKLEIEFLNYHNFNYDVCISNFNNQDLYDRLVYLKYKEFVEKKTINRIFNERSYNYEFSTKKIVQKNLSNQNYKKKITNELQGVKSQNFKGHTWNGNIVSKEYYCQQARISGMQSWGMELFDKKGCNNKNIVKTKDENLFNWYALAKHPKTNFEFIATRVSNKSDAKKIALKKCYNFVTSKLNKIGYGDCSIDLIIDKKNNFQLAEKITLKQKNQKPIKLINVSNDNTLVDLENTSLKDIIDFDLDLTDKITLGKQQYEVLVDTDFGGFDGSIRKFIIFDYKKNKKIRDRYFINYYQDGRVEYIELQNADELENYWVYDITSNKSNDWYSKRSLLVQGDNQMGGFKDRSDNKLIYGVFDKNNKSSNSNGSWKVWGLNKNKLNTETGLSNIQKKKNFDLAKFHYNKAIKSKDLLINLEKEFKEQILNRKLIKFAKKDFIIQKNLIVKKEHNQIQKIDSSKKKLGSIGGSINNFKDHIWNGNIVSKEYYCQQAKISGMDTWGKELFNKKGCTENQKIAKHVKENIDNNDNFESLDVFKEIDTLKNGDYYVFAHSTTGEKFWGSTKAKNNTSQSGKAFSSKGYECKLISKQKNKSAPYKGSFNLNCPNEKITGSWTQESNYSPSIGQAFTDNGDILTAFFSYRKDSIIEFAKKYNQTQNIKIANKNTLDQKEYEPDTDSQIKNKPPKLIVKNDYTFKSSSYEIKGIIDDEFNKVFIEIDGRVIRANDDRSFSIKRFSPVDEQIKIVAIDKWGSRSKPKIINVKIKPEETELVKKLDPLNPNSIKSQSNNNKVALIIGIEKYDQTPEASYANLDAKYFAEYARKAFGISKSNIELLVDQDANLIDSVETINLWLPGKIKDGETELIIFFAGHGLASNDGKELFLLSQDSNPDLLSRTALSRTELFKDIIKLNPKSVTVFLDTCYSGISRDEKTLLASARPVRIIADEQETPNNFTIFSASQLDQISSGLKEAKHGIFSYYLMKGLEGNADTNQDKKITNGELLVYMDENVSQKASELGRKQNPSLAGDPDKVLMSYR